MLKCESEESCSIFLENSLAHRFRSVAECGINGVDPVQADRGGATEPVVVIQEEWIGVGTSDGFGMPVPPRHLGFFIRVGMQTRHVKRNFWSEIQMPHPKF